MSDDSLDARLRAVERRCADAPSDADADRPSLVPAERIDDVDERLLEVERRLDALDAAVQSVRGYVGAIEAVNEAVERRADAALAVAERLEDDRSTTVRNASADDAAGRGGFAKRETRPVPAERADDPEAEPPGPDRLARFFGR